MRFNSDVRLKYLLKKEKENIKKSTEVLSLMKKLRKNDGLKIKVAKADYKISNDKRRNLFKILNVKIDDITSNYILVHVKGQAFNRIYITRNDLMSRFYQILEVTRLGGI